MTNTRILHQGVLVHSHQIGDMFVPFEDWEGMRARLEEFGYRLVSGIKTDGLWTETWKKGDECENH